VELDSLRAALDRLVARGVLDRDQAGAVLAEVGPPAGPGTARRRLLGEIAGYLGASFVVGATLLFLGERWDELGRGGRFAILAAMAVILFGSGLVVRLRRGPGDDVRRRLSSTLFTGAAAAAAFAAFAGLRPAGPDVSGFYDNDTAWFVAALTGLVVVLAGYLLARSALGQLGIAAAGFAGYGTLLNLLSAADPVPLGLGTIALGVGWAGLYRWRVVAERSLALVVAVTFGLLGAQLVVLDDGTAASWLGYLLTAAVAGICFAAYEKLRSWVVLAGGVAGATLVVPEFLYEVTDGSLGASGVLLGAGVTLLAGSLASLRIRREART